MMHEANRTNKSFVGLEAASEQCETVNSLSEDGNYEVGKIILEEQLKYLECLRNNTEEPVPWKNNKVVQKYLCGTLNQPVLELPGGLDKEKLDKIGKILRTLSTSTDY